MLISNVFSHSYLTSPTSRSNQKQTESGCRGPACLGPCDVPVSGAKTPAVTIARGTEINAQWPRNNHAGGFIRFSWAPTSQSDSATAFNDGVLEINCHEVGGCKPSNPADPNGGDSGAPDGSFQPCQYNITVPPHLTNGAWTLQWAWFGGAFSLGDYYSCVDYIISGGPTGAKPNPVFHGGDYADPDQNVCKFFNTDRLGQCVDEPCNNPLYTAAQQQIGVPYGFSSSSNSLTSQSLTTNTQTTHSVTTQSLSTKSITSHSITTQAMKSITTQSSSKAITSGRSLTSSSLTTVKPIYTTNSPLSLTTSSDNGNDQNCAGATNLTQSYAQITTINTWSNMFQIIIQLHVVETVLTDWLLEIIWPDGATSTQIINIYNGGSLYCQSTTPVRHAMIAPVADWANNIESGDILSIEVQAINSNMVPSFIVANTILKVYTQ